MLRRRAFVAGTAATVAAGTAPRAAAVPSGQKVLRVVPQAEPQAFDPVFAQVNNVTMHGAMVYDQLFGWDDKMNVQPQMVDDWKLSDDRLLYTFTLRRGLKFHDGSDVTTRDVIPSLKRMFVRDTQNQILAKLIDHVSAHRRPQLHPAPERTVRLHRVPARRKQRRGRRHHAREGRDDRPVQPVRDRIGSGPFRFVEAEYVPGASWSMKNSTATCRDLNPPAVLPAARW